MRHHDRNGNRIDSGSLFWGLVLIGIGSIFLLDRLELGDMHYVIRNYWPGFVIAMGVSRLFQRGHVWNGLWLIAVGTWLQAVVLHLGGLTYRNSWPLLAIFLGVSMVLQTLIQGTRSWKRSSGDAQTKVRHDI